jgi:hypothetical protein
MTQEALNLALDHKTWAKAIEAKLKQKNGYADSD